MATGVTPYHAPLGAMDYVCRIYQNSHLVRIDLQGTKAILKVRENL